MLRVGAKHPDFIIQYVYVRLNVTKTVVKPNSNGLNVSRLLSRQVSCNIVGAATSNADFTETITSLQAE